MESSNCGHSENRLLKEIDHSGCLALYSFNILDDVYSGIFYIPYDSMKVCVSDAKKRSDNTIMTVQPIY